MEPLDLNRTPYVADLQRGLLEEGYFLVKKIMLQMGKSGKPFLRLLLSDRTGYLPAVYFGPKGKLEELARTIPEGAIVKVKGVLEDFQEVLQLRLFDVQVSDKSEWELSRFVRRTPHDRRQLYKGIKRLLVKIENKELRILCFHFLKDKNFMKLFLEAPASRYAHHAYVGGLLEHTLNVMKLCDAYSRIYENTNKDLLLAGAFLHDIGKVDEFRYLFDVNTSVEGKLKGHTLLGYERLQKKLPFVSLPPKLKLKLEHILLSHQGKRIWGAVEEPRFVEAYLVHAADSTDSAQFIYSNAKARSIKSDEPWSEFISYLGREVYLG
ncbi:MAG: HD domain-containing protein [Candidatus Hydrogenedentota bacterium]|nr:MAG: HD domain-containing protein [Candidatus Hydrogenedentota bacterium]